MNHDSQSCFKTMGASIMSLFLLAALGWVVRKQVGKLTAPVRQQLTHCAQKPWAQSISSWLKAFPLHVNDPEKIRSSEKLIDSRLEG